MAREYIAPAVFIRAYEISKNITTSAQIADGLVDTKDDNTLDMSGFAP